MANTYFDSDGHIYHPVYVCIYDFGFTLPVSPTVSTVEYNFNFGMYDGFDVIGNELDLGY